MKNTIHGDPDSFQRDVAIAIPADVNVLTAAAKFDAEPTLILMIQPTAAPFLLRHAFAALGNILK